MPKYKVKINCFIHGGRQYSKGQIIETDSPIEEKHPGQVRMLDDKNAELPPLSKRRKIAAKQAEANKPKPVIPVENFLPSMEELMTKE